MAVDVRNLLQLPLSYMGNAVLGIQIFTEPEAISACPVQSNGESIIAKDVSSNDVAFVANLARQTQETTQKITGTYVKGEISHRCASNDWASYARPGDISVSSIRRLSLYELDFGSSLGRVRNFDLPENRISGLGWIMPIRFEGAPWEVSIAFEPRIMEGVQKDRLMKWMCAKQMPKL
ncbi:Transferase [Penicillium frequentans]|nr:Transferase [Penicillium glabrum]